MKGHEKSNKKTFENWWKIILRHSVKVEQGEGPCYLVFRGGGKKVDILNSSRIIIQGSMEIENSTGHFNGEKPNAVT